jgi:hypothetical protein
VEDAAFRNGGDRRIYDAISGYRSYVCRIAQDADRRLAHPINAPIVRKIAGESGSTSPYSNDSLSSVASVHRGAWKVRS